MTRSIILCVAIELTSFVLGNNKAALAEMPFGAKIRVVADFKYVEISKITPQENLSIPVFSPLVIVSENNKTDFVSLSRPIAADYQRGWQWRPLGTNASRREFQIHRSQFYILNDCAAAPMIMKAKAYCEAKLFAIPDNNGRLKVRTGSALYEHISPVGSRCCMQLAAHDFMHLAVDAQLQAKDKCLECEDYQRQYADYSRLIIKHQWRIIGIWGALGFVATFGLHGLLNCYDIWRRWHSKPKRGV